MNYKKILDDVANRLESTILEISDSVKIPTEDFGWDNRRYISEKFRISHIERYSDNNLEVLHFTCFPSPFCDNPIFGFDIITTEKKCLAAFLDWSPVNNDLTYVSPHTFKTPYNLPEWAKSIFSKDVIAIVPDDDEFYIVAEIANKSFEEYIEKLGNCVNDTESIFEIKRKQNIYCENQRKNERTFNVLKSKLGKERALHFMNEILFPTID